MRPTPESEFAAELKSHEIRLLSELRAVRTLLRAVQSRQPAIRIGIESEPDVVTFFKIDRMPRPDNVIDIRPQNGA